MLLMIAQDKKRHKSCQRRPEGATFFCDQGLELDKHKNEDNSNEDVFRLSGAQEMEQGSVSYHGSGNL